MADEDFTGTGLENDAENNSDNINDGMDSGNTDNDNGQGNSNTSDEIERQAKEDGWVAKEDYRGDPEKWVSADEFVERGKHINRILQSKLKRQEAEMETLRNGVNEFKKFTQSQIDKKQVDLETALSQLKSAKAEAIRNGDGDAVNEIDDRIDATKDELRDVKSVTKQEVQQQDPELTADFERWKTKNTWYGSDIEATKAADKVAQKLRKQGENRVGSAFLRIVDETVRDEYPELFTNQNRNRASSVSNATGKPNSESIESFKRQLPKQDHDFMLLGIREKWFIDEADFMKQYKSL